MGPVGLGIPMPVITEKYKWLLIFQVFVGHDILGKFR